MTRHGRRRLRNLRADDRGVSAIEFALVAPIILTLLAAVVDFGMLVQTRAGMESAVSTAMSYALARGQDADAASAANYAGTIAEIASAQLGGDTSVEVTLNRSFVTRRGTGASGQEGAASAITFCYCPERDEGGIVWGDNRACGAPCPDGGYAGAFVAIKATRPYQPLFLDYGLVSSGQVAIETLAGVQ